MRTRCPCGPGPRRELGERSPASGPGVSGPRGESGLRRPRIARAVGARSIRLPRSSLTVPGESPAAAFSANGHRRYSEARVVEGALAARGTPSPWSAQKKTMVPPGRPSSSSCRGSRRPASPCPQCCRTCARAPPARPACRGSRAERHLASVTGGFPPRAGLDGKALALVGDLQVEHQEEGCRGSARFRQCAARGEVIPDREGHPKLVVRLARLLVKYPAARRCWGNASRDAGERRDRAPAAPARCPPSSACGAPDGVAYMRVMIAARLGAQTGAVAKA